MVNRHDVVWPTDHVVKNRIAERMMYQKQVRSRTRIALDRTDPLLQTRRDVFSIDIRFISQPLDMVLQFEHLLSDRITLSRSRMELVNGGVFRHLVATMA